MKFIKKYLEYYKNNPERYWFKSKLYGYGWVPVRWQGFAVILAFILLITLNAFRLENKDLNTEETVRSFIFQTLALVVILIAICIKTGERPRFRWGLSKENNNSLASFSKETKIFLFVSLILTISIFTIGLIILISALNSI